MGESDWITTNQLKNKFGIEDYHIMVAIKKHRLEIYNSRLIKIARHQVTPDRKEADRINELSLEIEKRRLEDPQNPKYYPTSQTYVLDDCLFKETDVQKIWDEKKSEPRKNKRREKIDAVFSKCQEIRMVNPKIKKVDLYDHPEVIEIYGGEKKRPTFKTFCDRHTKGLNDT